MDLIKFLRSKFGKNVGEERRVEKISLEQARALLEEKKTLSMAPFLTKASETREAVFSAVENLRCDVKAFGEKKLDKEMQGYKIAAEMKENFLKRVKQLFSETKLLEPKNFGELEKFGEAVWKLNNDFSKISLNNRYLFIFFPKELEPVVSGVKEIEETIKEIKEIIEESRGKNAGVEKALEKCLEAEKTINEIKAREEKVAELSKDVEEKKTRYEKTSADNSLKQETTEVEKKSGEERGKLDGKQTEIASLLQPLERVFRKFEKTCLDKELIKTARAYSSNYSKALESEEKSLPKLKKLCEEVRKQLDERKYDEEKRDKLLLSLDAVSDGKLNELVSKAEKTLAAVNAFEEEIKLLNARRKEVEREKEELEESGQKLLEERRRQESLEKTLEKTLKELSEDASRELGKPFEIARS